MDSIMPELAECSRRRNEMPCHFREINLGWSADTFGKDILLRLDLLVRLYVVGQTV